MEKLLIVNEVLQWCAVLVIVLWLIFTAAVYRRVFDLQDAEKKAMENRIKVQVNDMREDVIRAAVAGVAKAMRSTKRGF